MIKLGSYVSYGAQALNYFFHAQAQLGLVDFSQAEAWPGSTWVKTRAEHKPNLNCVEPIYSHNLLYRVKLYLCFWLLLLVDQYKDSCNGNWLVLFLFGRTLLGKIGQCWGFFLMKRDVLPFIKNFVNQIYHKIPFIIFSWLNWHLFMTISAFWGRDKFHMLAYCRSIS